MSNEAPDARPSRPPLADWKVVLLVVGAALLVWAPGLHGEFISDDNANIESNVHIRDLSNWWFLASSQDANATYATYPHWRPLRMLSNMVDYQVAGLNPAWYRFVNLLWHGLGVGLLYALARRLGLGRVGAAVAALLFALHPVQSESVLWPKERDGLMSAAFIFGALLCALGKSWPSAFACVVLVALSLLAKETGVTFIPLVVLVGAVDWASGRRTRDFAWRIGGLAAAGTLVFAAYMVARGMVLPGAAQMDGPIGGVWAATIWTMFEVFFRYLGLIFVPRGLFLSWDFIDPAGGPQWMRVGGVLALGGLLAAAWLLRKRAPVSAAGVLFFLFALGPVSNLLPMVQWMAVRFLYLPMAGVGLAAGGLLELGVRALARDGRLSSSPVKRPETLAFLLLVGCALLSIQQTFVWRTEAALGAYQWQAGNRSLEARWLYASSLLRGGATEEAAAIMEDFPFDAMPAKKVGPFLLQGAVRARLGDFEGAYRSAGVGLARLPNDLRLRQFRAKMAMETRRFDEAEAILLGLAERPGFEHDSWSRLSVLYDITKRHQEAREARAEADRHEPVTLGEGP